MYKQLSYSPLRYPGGKSTLSNFLADVLCLNDLNGGSYYEPYAGGAAVGIMLLVEGLVNKIFINDFDFCVYSFWSSVLKENDRFIENIYNVDLSINEWKDQREIYRNPRKHKRFDVGFASFYLNRCNRSGIMKNAGPIGGIEQNGKWKIGARFNRSTLVERVKLLNKFRNQIKISHLDGIEFLSNKLPRGNERKKVLVYLDPPYYSKGPQLYLNSYSQRDHSALAKYIKKQKELHWIITYDDVPEIRSLYQDSIINYYSLNYSAQSKKQGQELLVSPDYLLLPTSLTIHKRKYTLSKKQVIQTS